MTMPSRFAAVSGMVTSLALVLGLGAGGGTARAEETLRSPVLADALSAAATVPGARVEIVALDRSAGDCVTSGPAARAEVPRPIEGSGRFAVKLTGARPGGAACETWAWARVRVFAPVTVAERAIRAGEDLAGATRVEEREIKAGHVPAVMTAGAVADRALGAGQVIEADVVRAPGPRPGEPVKVLIVAGALVVEQIGRAVSCGRGATCAVLPSGKHVEGTLVDGRLLVRTP
ncbi:MAG: hypothetical protein ABUL77_05255 [Bacteroidota bacterium]